jgi:hypothetical protein
MLFFFFLEKKNDLLLETLLEINFLKIFEFWKFFKKFLKKNLNTLSENKKKKIFSKNKVLLKKFFLLKTSSQELFQYMWVPKRFKIGKLDWPIFIKFLSFNFFIFFREIKWFSCNSKLT